jgi:D-alanyl-D-alanine carboxypeptidase
LADTIARYFRQMETGEAGPERDPFAAADREAFIEDFWRWSLGEAGLPEKTAKRVAAAAAEGPAFIMDMLAAVQGDPFLHLLVDKQHSLPQGYAPDDLVELGNGSCAVSRRGLMLRRAAAEALEEMAAAAKAEGITLSAASAYRSYEYQTEVYARNVRESGQEAADRESARPGYSQHQLGLALDFGPIDDSFAETDAGRWVLRNAGRFGWSLSFPAGYEDATGYRWESWHYRYVGRELASFIDSYFDGIQQYALQFIHAWEAFSDSP